MRDNWSDNCLFAAEALWALLQYLKAIAFSVLLFLLVASVYVLRQRAAVSSPPFGWKMASSSAKSQCWGPIAIRRRCYVTITTTVNWSTWAKSRQKVKYFFYFSISTIWRGGGCIRRANQILIQSLRDTNLEGKLLYAEIQFKRLA